MDPDEKTAPEGAGAGLTGDGRPPRDSVFRAIAPGLELRRDTGDSSSGMPTMVVNLARFDEWTEINSVFEGHFLERFAPGSLKKTIKEGRNRMRVLFNHGLDPSVGKKVLGPIELLEERADGAWGEVPLYDTHYNRELLPGIEDGQYGASVNFMVMREEFVPKPRATKRNPTGIPERTILEARLQEFGPVTFPAYENTSTGVRSVTDEVIMARFIGSPHRLEEAARSGVSLTGVELPWIPSSATWSPATTTTTTTNVTAVVEEREEDVDVDCNAFENDARETRDDAGEPEPPAATTPETHEEPERSVATTPVKKRFKTREEYLRWISRT